MKASQRTSRRFATLITQGHIVPRKVLFLTPKLFFFPPLSWLLQGTEPKHWYTTQFFWPVQAGSAPGNWAAKRQKGGKSIPALFCEPNLSWQQNVPFVIKAAFLGQVISHCLSLEWTTALPLWLWIITRQMFCLHSIVLRWLRCWLVGPSIYFHFSLKWELTASALSSFCWVITCFCESYLSRYDLPQYGSRRKLISPSGLYDEYGEVVVDDDGSYYYSPQESDGEVKKTEVWGVH